MTPQSAPDNQPELFNLAATLAGVPTVDLLKVRQDGDALIVILCTGQKYRFDGGDIFAQLGADIETFVRAQLEQLAPPAPAPDPRPAKKTKGA